MQEVEVKGNQPGAEEVPGDPFDAVQAVAQQKEAADGTGLLTGATAETEAEGEYGEFEWPDGYVADPKALAKFVPVAKELGLGREAAQSLASLYARLDQERADEQNRFIAENNAKWLREIHSHPEFGGRNLERTGENVASMFRRYGTPLLTAQIRQMNVQNWPEMFFFLARVSQAVSEDCSPSSAAAAAPEKSTAQLLFPGLK